MAVEGDNHLVAATAGQDRLDRPLHARLVRDVEILPELDVRDREDPDQDRDEHPARRRQPARELPDRRRQCRQHEQVREQEILVVPDRLDRRDAGGEDHRRHRRHEHQPVAPPAADRGHEARQDEDPEDHPAPDQEIEPVRRQQELAKSPREDPPGHRRDPVVLLDPVDLRPEARHAGQVDRRDRGQHLQRPAKTVAASVLLRVARSQEA